MAGISERIASRFWLKVDKNGPIPAHCPELGPCWIWNAGKHPQGYGKFKAYGETLLAHRVSLAMLIGRAIRDGFESCHRCDNESCVRPSHLFEGTPKQNVHDSEAKGRRAYGSRHWTKMSPEKCARGDRNGSRLHPERLRHFTGETNAMSKLTAGDVRSIRSSYAEGVDQHTLGMSFRVSNKTISKIVLRQRWRHVA